MGKHSPPKRNVSRARLAAALAVVTGGGLAGTMVTASPAAAVTLSPAQVASYAKQGCPSLSSAQINTAVKIAGAESKLRTEAHNPRGEDSRGLWQINVQAHGSPWGNLFDPLTNARAMCDVSGKGSNWRPWTTYVNGDWLNEPGFLGTPSTPGTPRPAPKPPVKPDGTRPEATTPHDHYTVVKGDTLFEVAKAKGVKNWQELHRWNTRVVENPDLIYPGEVLNVPRGGTKPPPASTAPSTSKYVKPINANSSRPFGFKSAGYTLGYHTGLDFSAAAGTPVVAVTKGVVVASDTGAAYGTNVQIKTHDGKYLLYAHLSSKSVVAGQVVVAGQKVGAVGSTGNSSGPHLHFEVRTAPTFAAGNFLNPSSYLASHGL